VTLNGHIERPGDHYGTSVYANERTAALKFPRALLSAQTIVRGMLRRELYSAPMDAKHSVEIPGIEFLVNDHGETRAVLIDLKKHGALWEDLYDAYLVHARRREPHESLAKVKRLLRRATKRRTRA
jgi:hypothetical protein